MRISEQERKNKMKKYIISFIILAGLTAAVYYKLSARRKRRNDPDTGDTYEVSE